jgi:hypothetical protein
VCGSVTVRSRAKRPGRCAVSHARG